MPELSLSPAQYESIRHSLESRCFLICGVGSAASAAERGTNEVRFWFPQGTPPTPQSKHHPWVIDGSQINRYGLAGVLDPATKWWEFSNFKGRAVNFLALRQDFVISVLICEDLARQDPVATVVRTVGPNLIIALLMDGPQTTDRWSAKYATVFADDPGSSVLAVTSKGMANLRSSAKSRPNVVAIWKDAFSPALEIEMPDDASGFVLTIAMKRSPECTADGRVRQGDGVYSILSPPPVFV